MRLPFGRLVAPMPFADGIRRALRAWPMVLLLTAFAALLAPALEIRNRMAAADFGIGGFPFNISNRDYYAALSPAESATLAFLFLAWVFLSGGIIDRLARDTRSGGTRFFAACGACFGPLLRLALMALAAYAAVLTWVEPALARVETTNDSVRMMLFGALAMLIFAIALVFDYARVRLVIEDRRSAAGAILAALRFIRAYPGRVLGTQALFWMLLTAWIALRGFIDVQPDSLASHLVAGGELLLKLALIGTQCAIYQSALASPGWVARAEPKWPDEPSANPAAL